MGLKLKLTDVILGPVISDKAYKLNQDRNELILRVHKHANKPLIAQAVQTLFNAQVEKVRTYIRKGKKRRVGKMQVHSNDEKRAIIKLKEGYRIDLMGQSAGESPAVEQQPESQKS